MDPSRFLRFPPLVPLLIAAFMAADSLPAVTNATGSTLDCTHDFEERMFCQLKAQNCTDHSLKLRSNSGYGEGDGVFEACGTGRCCCSVLLGDNTLVYGDDLTATVRKDAEVVESKAVPVIGSYKPKAPTLVSVKESSGNIQLLWRTSAPTHYVGTTLTANVTYHKKGSREKVTKSVESVNVDELRFYEIPGGDLEPNTTYAVSVRSFTRWSGRYSDSSQELEITTAASPRSLLPAVVVGLSAFAVMATAAVFVCYVKLKKKWWDTAASPKPLIPHPLKTQQVLKPKPPVVSSVNVLPCDPDDSKSCLQVLLTDTSGGSAQRSSGVGTGSSNVSYAKAEPDVRLGVQNALSELFPHLSPVSPAAARPLGGDPVLRGLGAADTSSGSSGVDNRSYSLVIPCVSPPADRVEAQTPPCVSAYRPSEGDAVPCAGPAPTRLLMDLTLLASPLVPTDMSYRQCGPDPAYAEDSGLSSVSSGSNPAAPCDPCCDEGDGGADRAEAAGREDNPCYAPAPAAPLVVDAYQAFQKVASGQPEASSGQNPAVVPGFPHSQGLPGLHRPLLSLVCAQIPVMANTGYQSV